MPPCQPRRARGGGAALQVRTRRGDQDPDPPFWGGQSRARGWPGRLPVSWVARNRGGRWGTHGGPRAAVPQPRVAPGLGPTPGHLSTGPDEAVCQRPSRCVRTGEHAPAPCDTDTLVWLSLLPHLHPRAHRHTPTRTQLHAPRLVPGGVFPLWDLWHPESPVPSLSDAGGALGPR